MDNLLTLTDEEFCELFNNVLKERNRRQDEKRNRDRERLRELLDEAQEIIDTQGFYVEVNTDFDGDITSFGNIEN